MFFFGTVLCKIYHDFDKRWVLQIRISFFKQEILPAFFLKIIRGKTPVLRLMTYYYQVFQT